MVFISHHDAYPAEMARAGFYRIEANPSGGWDVYLDPPANPLGPPIGEPVDEIEN